MLKSNPLQSRKMFDVINILLFVFYVDSDVDKEAQFSIEQSRDGGITMRENYGNLPKTIHDNDVDTSR